MCSCPQPSGAAGRGPELGTMNKSHATCFYSLLATYLGTGLSPLSKVSPLREDVGLGLIWRRMTCPLEAGFYLSQEIGQRLDSAEPTPGRPCAHSSGRKEHGQRGSLPAPCAPSAPGAGPTPRGRQDPWHSPSWAALPCGAQRPCWESADVSRWGLLWDGGGEPFRDLSSLWEMGAEGFPGKAKAQSLVRG